MAKVYKYTSYFRHDAHRNKQLNNSNQYLIVAHVSNIHSFILAVSGGDKKVSTNNS